MSGHVGFRAHLHALVMLYRISPSFLYFFFLSVIAFIDFSPSPLEKFPESVLEEERVFIRSDLNGPTDERWPRKHESV